MHSLDIDQTEFWQSIFDNIQMNYIPFEYVYFVTVTFDNGSTKIFELPKEIRESGIISFEKFLRKLSMRYRKHITDVRFKLDVDRLKQDVTAQTKNFL